MNKEILQQHNTRLSENNVDINDILNIANSLPTIDEVVSLQDKTVEPSKETQVITADGEYTGLGTVTVNAIQSDSLEINPSTEEQTFDGMYDNVKVNPVTNEIDRNITSSNIKEGITILGVEGNLKEHKEPVLQDKTIEPSTIDQTITADENYNGLGTVTVKGDSDLIPENIKKGVNIFGVEGEIEVIDYWSEEKASGAGSNNFSIPLHLRIIPKKINASYISSLSGTFRNYYSLEEADFSEWEFPQTVNNLNGMFSGCTVLKKVDINNLDTTNVTDMSSMFYNCKSLESLDLSKFNTANVTGMSTMFSGCSSLRILDIRNFTFSKVTSYSSIFGNIPKDCLIIVKGDTERDWVLDKRGVLTNVKTVAEL